jgi:hypothetical protein
MSEKTSAARTADTTGRHDRRRECDVRGVTATSGPGNVTLAGPKPGNVTLAAGSESNPAEDLVQVAALVLVKATRRFRAGRGHALTGVRRPDDQR